MDWYRAMNEERAALQRIVALLFSFARLAEIASRRSDPVRGFVLWILRRAVVAAYELVIDEAYPSDTLFRPGNTPADARRLARTFRDLARELDRQLVHFYEYEEPGQTERNENGFDPRRVRQHLPANPGCLPFADFTNLARASPLQDTS